MYRKTIVLVFFAVLLAAGCTRSERRSLTAAPDFTLPDLNGRNVHLADLKGKVVLVEFWATWCAPCQESIPGIERLHRSYGGKGLVVLGVSVDEGGLADVKAFVRENGMTYTVLQGDADVMGNYRIRGIPATFIVNRDGIIAKQYSGAGFDESIEKDIRDLL
jgi:cytochrome c biogenesis protein CcmG/thiol:disulfide interchange protein DsbE